MLFDFTEAERNTARRALEIYVSELIEVGRHADCLPCAGRRTGRSVNSGGLM
jgi:hypothetical protein